MIFGWVASASWHRALALATCFAAGALASAVPSRARAADDPVAAEAKRHYDEGTKAFNLGEFPRAIAEFKATYNVKPDPLLLYNIAQSYRLQGDPAQALFFYKSFLRNMPYAANRKEVEGKIKALEKQVAEPAKDAAARVDSAKAPGRVAPAAGAAAEIETDAESDPARAAAAPMARAPGAATPGTPPVAMDEPAASGSPAPPGRPAEPGSAPVLAAAAPTSPPPAAASTVAVSPATAVPSLATQMDLGARAPSAPPSERPIYKKWWFWVGSAAVVLVIGGVIARASSSKAPSTLLGTYSPTFM